MASIEELLAEYEQGQQDLGVSSIIDQYLALTGQQPKKEEEGLDLMQPVRTAFSAFAAPGGLLAGQIAPEAYATALEEQRAALGVTDESPWYERVEALPGAGGVITGAMSPEFKASGVGRVVAPVTQILGDLALDPTTYLSLGASAAAKGAARAAGAGKLMDAAAAGVRSREAMLAAARASGMDAKALAAAQATADAMRADEAAKVAAHVLTEGTGAQKAIYKAGGFLQQAEPIAFAAPAALAYGPQVVSQLYETVKGIPESETPIADAASAALLTGLTALMGKGLMSANDAARSWHAHAKNSQLTKDVIDQGNKQILAAASPENVTPEAPVEAAPGAVPEALPALPALDEVPGGQRLPGDVALPALREDVPTPALGEPLPVLGEAPIAAVDNIAEAALARDTMPPSLDEFGNPTMGAVEGPGFRMAEPQGPPREPTGFALVPEPAPPVVPRRPVPPRGAMRIENAPVSEPTLRRPPDQPPPAPVARPEPPPPPAPAPAAAAVVPDAIDQYAAQFEYTPAELARARELSKNIKDAWSINYHIMQERKHGVGKTAPVPGQLTDRTPGGVDEPPIFTTSANGQRWQVKRTGRTRKHPQNDDVLHEVIMDPVDADGNRNGTGHIDWRPESEILLRQRESGGVIDVTPTRSEDAPVPRPEERPAVEEQPPVTAHVWRKAGSAPEDSGLSFRPESELSKLQREESNLLTKLQRDGDLPPADMARLEEINGRINQLMDEPAMDPDTYPNEPRPDRTVRSLVDPEEMAAAKLTPNEEAYLKERIVEGGASEREAFDEIMKQRDYRRRNPPPPEPPPLDMGLRPDEATPEPTKPTEAPPTKPTEAPPEPPKPAAEAPPATEGGEPLATVAPRGRRVSDAQMWEGINRGLDDLISELEAQKATTKRDADLVILRDKKAEWGRLNNDQKREVLEFIRANYKGQKGVGRGKSYLYSLLDSTKKGEQLNELTGTRATGTSLETQGPGTRAKAPSRGEIADAAIAKVREKYGSLQAWMDSLGKDELIWIKRGDKKSGTKDVVHDLKNDTTTEARIWQEYVRQIDAGLSDAKARIAVAEKLNITGGSDTKAPNRVNIIVGRGRTHAQDAGKALVLEAEGLEAPPVTFDRPTYDKLKAGADKDANDLFNVLDKTGAEPDDIAKMLGTKEFRAAAEPIMDAYAQATVMARRGKLGPNDPGRKLDSLRRIAIKMGIPESQIKSKGAPEILQYMADAMGLKRDYIGLLRDGGAPIERAPKDVFTPTFAHKVEWDGGREGVLLRVAKIDDAEVLANDIIKNAEVNKLTVGGGVKDRDMRPLRAALAKEGITLEAIDLDSDSLNQPFNVIRADPPPPDRIEEQAARNLNLTRGRPVEVDVNGQKITVYESDWIYGLSKKDAEWATEQVASSVNKINAELKARNIRGLNTDALELIHLAGGHDAKGTYHAVYQLPNAVGPNGETYILRVGKSPYIPLPNVDQRALVQPTVAHGVLGYLNGRVPVFWTVHQTNMVQRGLWGADFGDLGEAAAKMVDLSGPYTLKRKLYRELRARMLTEMPEGMSLKENIRAIREFQSKADAAGLAVTDMSGLTKEGAKSFRGDQLGWVEATGQKVPEGSVVRTVTDGQGRKRVWRLVANDFGTVSPMPHATPSNSVWKQLTPEMRLGLQTARAVDNAPPRLVEPRTMAERLVAYAEDFERGIPLGTTLRLANHDRIMSGEYLETYARLATPTAEGLKKIHDDFIKLLGRHGEQANTEFGGLTASPHLSGLYHEEAGKGRIFVNVVEAANFAKTYDEAVDDMLYTMIHEVAHHRYSGHGTPFVDFEDYLRSLAKAEGAFDQYRDTLRGSFSKDTYERMRSELVPDFDSARSKYGTGEGGSQATGQRGVPAGDSAGRAAAIEGGRTGSQAGAEGNRGAGLRPGQDVQAGDQGTPGQLRAGAAAGRSAAAPPTTRGEVGSAAGQGEGASASRILQQLEDGEITDDEAARLIEAHQESGADWVDDPDPETVARLMQPGRIDTRRRLGKSDIQELVDSIMDSARTNLRPVQDAYRMTWDYAKMYVDHLTHDEKLEAANSLPSPRKEGQLEGVLNLLHYPDMDLDTKARIYHWYQFTKGLWPRDKVQHWADVSDDIQELLGTKTPEEWTRIFKTRGGGLTAHDVELLRIVTSELASKVRLAEERLYDGLQAGVTGDKLDALRADVDYQERAFHHSIFNITKGLTGVARALAIARHEVRSLDPQLRMEQDMRAGLRERLAFKFKDKLEVEQKVNELMDKFLEIRRSNNGNWQEFYEAYRAMLGSSLWPDKILEFYKAGLLGWPSRVANISSNSLFRSVRYIEDAMAGAIDKTYSVLKPGAERSRYIGEATVSAMALQRATSEAFRPWLKAQGDAFALRPDDIQTAMARGGLMEDMLMHPGAIEGKLGEFLRFNFKGLSSDDALAKHISRVDSMYRQIYRKVRSGEYKLNTGETHAAATARIYDDLLNNFETATRGKGQYEFSKLKQWQDMATVAEEAAKHDTFQADLGNFGRGMNWLLRNVPALQVIFPFVRTPTNIAKESIKRTPLGLIEIAAKWKKLTPGERVTELAKPAVGSLIGAALLAKAMDGSVTGGGPLDPDELEALKATGWQPYSVKIGDNWVSYQRFEPIAAIFGIAADAAEGLRNGDFDRWQDGTMRVFTSTAENITNKTFLSGLDGMFSAVSHPKQYLNRFVKQMQGSLIPNSLGFVPVSGVTRAIDPIYRQSDALDMNVFYAKMPWLSETLDPQYGPTGEERRRPGSTLERALSPFARTTVKTGPAADGAEEVVRLSAAPKLTSRYWIGRGGVRVNYTSEEKAALAKAYRDATAVIGQRLIKDPNYKKLPDDEFDPNYKYGMKTKKDVIRKIYNGYRDTVMTRIKPSLEARAMKQVQEQQRG